MGRTNVVIDDELIDKVMRMYRLPTKRAAIEFALRAVAGETGVDRQSMLDLEGTGWDGDLDEMRRSDPVQEW